MSTHLEPIPSHSQADYQAEPCLEIAPPLYQKSLQTGEEIRVFKLVSISDDIAGHFIVHDLNDLRYSTLSYVWNPALRHPHECRCAECATDDNTHDGDHHEQCRCALCHTNECGCEHCHPVMRTIYCGGQPIEVQQNCWAALKHIGSQLLQDDLPIWVDAICINQGDDQEKRHQINDLMGTIYSRSEKGFIWLGEGNERTDAAMDYLSRGGIPFGTAISYYGGVPIQEQLASTCFLAWKMAFYLLRMNPYDIFLLHYEGLREALEQPRLRNPWITRLWTLQETVLARRSILVCGQRSIEWLAMVYALDFIKKSENVWLPAAFPDWKRLVDLWKEHTEQSSVQVMSPSPLDPILQNHELLNVQLQRRRQVLRSADIIRFRLRFTNWVGYIMACLGILSALRIGVKAVGVSFVGLLVMSALWYRVGMRLAAAVRGRPFLKAHERDSYPTPIYERNEALIIEVATREVTRPKDKYKGILGIMGEGSPWENADEPKALSSIYRALFAGLLRQSKSLDILLFIALSISRHSQLCPIGGGVHSYRTGGHLEICEMCTKREHCVNCADQEPCSSCVSIQRCGPCSQNKACRVCISLAQCPACTRMDNCPSWVVDWRKPGLHWLDSLYKWGIVEWRTHSEIPRHDQIAWGFGTPSIDFTSSHMLVKGMIIGKLHYSQGLSPGDEDNMLEEHLKPFMAAIKWHVQHAPFSQDHAIRDLWQLTCWAERTCRRKITGANSYAWAKMMVDDEHGRLWICDYMRRHSTTWIPWRRARLTGIWRVHSVMVSFLTRNNLALVRSSTPEIGFGVAGNLARRGDNVALISGVSLPLLLRKDGDGYKVISPVFLPRVMDRNLWAGHIAEGRNVETIELV